MSNVPDDLVYTKEHEYVARHGDPAVVRIGITDYAQAELGDFVFVNLPKVRQCGGRPPIRSGTFQGGEGRLPNCYPPLAPAKVGGRPNRAPWKKDPPRGGNPDPPWGKGRGKNPPSGGEGLPPPPGEGGFFFSPPRKYPGGPPFGKKIGGPLGERPPPPPLKKKGGGPPGTKTLFKKNTPPPGGGWFSPPRGGIFFFFFLEEKNPPPPLLKKKTPPLFHRKGEGVSSLPPPRGV